MKKYIFAAIALVLVTTAGVFAYSGTRIDGAGDGGWVTTGRGTQIKRIVDQESGVVCYITTSTGSLAVSPGIDCVKN